MEKELLKLLEASNVDKNYLKKYAELLTKLRLNKLLLEDWHIKGQPSDKAFGVSGRIEKGNFDSLAKIVEMKGIKRVELFPKGIINPEFIDLQIQFDVRKF